VTASPSKTTELSRASILLTDASLALESFNI